MMIFVYAAYKLPAELGRQGKRLLPRLFLMWAVGVLGTFVFFFGFWLMPTLIPLWPIRILFGPVLVFLYTLLLKNYDWKKPSEKHLFALVSGALVPFIVFAPLQELDSSRTDNTFGMSLVGLAFLIGLLLLRKSVWAMSKER